MPRAINLNNVPRGQIISMTRGSLRLPRTKTSPRRDWYLLGIPTVQIVTSGELVIAARFSLGLDVPSKPRTTQRAKWVSVAYQDYLHWRQTFRMGLQTALASTPYGSSSDPLFSGVIAQEPKVRRSKRSRIPPLLILGTLATTLEGDFDNRAKSLCDASNGLLWTDDREIAGGGLVVVNAPGGLPQCDFTVLALPQDGRREQVLALWKPIGITWPKLDGAVKTVGESL